MGTKQANRDLGEAMVSEQFQTNTGADQIRYECDWTLSDPVNKSISNKNYFGSVERAPSL